MSLLTFYLCKYHRETLLEGLTILKNRGYDSAGIATVHGEGKGPMVCATNTNTNTNTTAFDLLFSPPSFHIFLFSHVFIVQWMNPLYRIIRPLPSLPVSDIMPTRSNSCAKNLRAWSDTRSVLRTRGGRLMVGRDGCRNVRCGVLSYNAWLMKKTNHCY